MILLYTSFMNNMLILKEIWVVWSELKLCRVVDQTKITGPNGPQNFAVHAVHMICVTSALYCMY